MPDQTASRREELLRRLLCGQHPTAPHIIQHESDAGPAPASPMQESLWFLDQLTAERSATGLINYGATPYNMGVALWVDNDPVRIQSVIDALVARHAALRTCLVVKDEKLLQRIDPDTRVVVRIGTLPQDPATQRRMLRDDLARRFDLATAPLMRCTLYQQGREGVLLVALHHTIGDGTSIDVLVHEFTALIAGEVLPEAPDQTPSDIARWQRERLAEPRAAKRLAYWISRLRGATPLNLAGPDPIQPAPGVLAHSSTFVLGSRTTQTLRELSARLHCSSFAIAVATLQTTLRLATGNQTITIGTPVDMRNRWNLSGVVGCLINTVLLHGRIDTTNTISALIQSAAEIINIAQNDAETPFESIVAELSPKRDSSMSPLCNVALARQSLPADGDGLRWADIEPISAQFPLTCHWQEGKNTTQVTLIADPTVLDERRCSDLADLWHRLIDLALKFPETPIECLPLSGEPPPETATIEPNSDATTNSTTTNHPQLHELFMRSPTEPLVIGENRDMTGAELLAGVQAWGQGFHTVGGADNVPSDEPVTVDNGDPLLVQQAVLGAWAAGRAVRVCEAIDEHPFVRLGAAQWRLDDPPTPLSEPAQLPGPGHYVWQWPDASRLSMDQLCKALWDLRDHINAAGPVTLTGEIGPVAVLAPLLRGNHLAPPRPGHRPRLAVGRAADLVTMPDPPKVMIVTDPVSEALGRWADEHEVTLVSSVLSPTVHLVSTNPGLVGTLADGNLSVATGAGVPLPSGCPGRLWVRRSSGAEATPWSAVVTRDGEIRWWEPQPQAWPTSSPEHIADRLGVPADAVERCTTTWGVIEYAAVAPPADCRHAALELGLPSRLIRPLTEMTDGSRVAVDDVLARKWQDRTGGTLAVPDSTGTWRIIDPPHDERRSLRVGPPRINTPLPPFALRAALQKYADNVAIIDPTAEPGSTAAELTYRELDLRVATLAHRLHDVGIGRGSVVAIQGSTDLDTLIALLAVVSLGATYAPLDRTHPRARREQIVQVLRPDLLIGDDEDLGIPRLAADKNTEKGTWSLEDIPQPESCPGDVLYVLFTSGSTGKPKGVEIRQAGAANLLESVGETLRFSPDSVIPAHTTISFDMSVPELLAPLLHGSRIVLCGPYSRDPQALLDAAARHHVTHLQATATLWRELTAIGGLDPAVVRISSGEPLPHDLALAITADGAQGWNFYGPTETTVYSTAECINPTDGSVSIGRPLANTTVAVVGADLDVLPVGVPGELMIGGVGVAQGYRGQPELTAERFVHLPGTPLGSVWYRTGDRAVMAEDGRLYHLGRADGQVKVRGHRVEIGEVERALEDDPAISVAVVDLVGDRLYALVQPADDASTRRADWPYPEHNELVDDVTSLRPAADVCSLRLQALWKLATEDRPAAGSLRLAVVGAGDLPQAVEEISGGRNDITTTTDPSSLDGLFDVIIADGLDRRCADQAELSARCAELTRYLTEQGRLVLPDILEPIGLLHASAAVSGDASGVLAPSPGRGLIVDAAALARKLDRNLQRRPRLDPSTLGDFRIDLILSRASSPRPVGPVWQWNDLGDTPLERLADAPHATIVEGIPDGRLDSIDPMAWSTNPTPQELAEKLPKRWRIHANDRGLVLAADGALPTAAESAVYDPWLMPDPALTHWANKQLPRIRERLGHRLPEYMIPNRIHPVAAFSRTVNLKVDRRRTHEFWTACGRNAPTESTDAPERTWMSCLAEQVADDPDAPALDALDGLRTRAQLFTEVTDLARHLAHLGVRAGDRVVIALPRDGSFIVGLLAVLRVRGVFVPLDISQPATRLRMVVEDARPRLLLTRSDSGVDLAGISADRLDIDTLGPAPADTPLPDIPTIPAEEAAYVIFTSGSTGRPKGVEVSHRGLSTLLEVVEDRLGEGPQRRVLQFAAMGFDALVWELVWSILSGATLVMRPAAELRPGPELITLLRDQRITDALIQPSVLAVLGEPESLPEGLTIMSGGEALTSSIVDTFGGYVRLVNAYGPTECTVISHVSEALHPGDVPVIGKPAPGLFHRILDEKQRPVAVGEIGELYLGGCSLALGYLGRPDLTAERFVRVPDEPDKRLYRTGDLVRDTGTGLVYIGRADDQIKIRGVRVEPGEVEAILTGFPEVENAVVLPVLNREPHLEAFINTPAGHSFSEEELLDRLSQRLPSVMIPTRIHIVTNWPVTANGKIDRRSLADSLSTTPQELGLVYSPDNHPPKVELAEHPVTDRHGRPTRALLRATDQDPVTCTAAQLTALFNTPQCTSERTADGLHGRIRRMWEDVLGCEITDGQADFFTIGGHSLRAAEVVGRLRAEGHDVTVSDFFAHPTIDSLVGLLHGRRRIVTDEELVAVTRLADDIRPERAAPMNPERTADPHHILVTGATGFLGSRVVIDLLANTSATVHCLVRGSTRGIAADRLHTQLSRFGLPYDTDRVDVLHGDLQMPLLGLGRERWDELSWECDTILHMGASVNLLDSFDHMMLPNMLGTTELLRLASMHRIKPFHHISTISVVLGKSLDQYRLDEDMGIAPESVLRSGYAMTKWGAEELVLQARERGLTANILRLSRVAQDRHTGTHNPHDAVLLFMRSATLIGSFPDGSPDFANSPHDAVPVDDLAEWIRVLMLRTVGTGRNYHLCSPDPLTYGQFGAALRRIGFPLRSVPLDDWSGELAAVGSDGDELVRVSSEVRAMSASLPELPHHVLDSSATSAALAEADVIMRNIDEDLLERHLRQLIDSGFLPTPLMENHA